MGTKIVDFSNVKPISSQGNFDKKNLPVVVGLKDITFSDNPLEDKEKLCVGSSNKH